MSNDIDMRHASNDHYYYKQQENAIQQPHLLSRIRRNFNSIALAPITSLFNNSQLNNSSYRSQYETEREYNQANIWDSCFHLDDDRTPHAQEENQCYGDVLFDNKSHDASTPTPTRSTTPLRVSDTKRRLNPFAPAYHPVNFPATHDMHLQAVPFSPPGSFDAAFPSYYNLQTDNTAAWIAHSSASATPPLTPDATTESSLSSSSSYGDQGRSAYEHYPAPQDDEDDEGYMRRHSLEIKEGKKPIRDINTDTLANEIPDTNVNATGEDQLASTAIDDYDSWYGLEYMLELSARERRLSDTQSISTGEHSKSHESWALLRQGRVPPSSEVEDYYQWKNWHRCLDWQDERRRHHKGLTFKYCAKELAWYFAEEMHTRDYMYWQKKTYGGISKDLKERLALIARNRPDPYQPAQKHNLGWYLKRSRSVSCLRELRHTPEPNIS